MHPTRSESDILRAVDDYYSTQLRRFGPVHLGVDWSSQKSQRLRFDVLLEAIRTKTTFSLIDYGCGYGALADYLALREMPHCEYIGYDISESMLDAARSRPCPLVSCRFAGKNDPLPEVDYCLASGVFNVSLGTEPEAWFTYMTRVWDEMNRVGRLAFAFNCLSTYFEGERRPHLLYYADPARVLDYCRRTYSPWVALLHDYPLPEFTVIVRKPQP
jgi:SAM-dependent methyltransferase